VLASCIYHAVILPKSRNGTQIVQTAKCPKHLRMIAKTNVGYPDCQEVGLMNAVLDIMRNNMSADTIMRRHVSIMIHTIMDSFVKLDGKISKMDKAYKQTRKLKKIAEELKEHFLKTVRPRIENLTRATIAEKGPFEQVATVIDLIDQCSGLILSNGRGINTLLLDYDHTDIKRVIQQFEHRNFMSYGAPKTRYLPTKNYMIETPVVNVRPSSMNNYYIGRYLDGHLHLGVGLRLDGRSYTVQVNVNLPEIARKQLKRMVPLSQVVSLVMNPWLKERVVELMCEEHPHLQTKKERLLALVKGNPHSDPDEHWDVALFDGGCSQIQGDPHYPNTLHVPSRSEHWRNNPEILMTQIPEAEFKHLKAPLSWESEPSRTPVSPRRIKLEKMEQYLTQKDPFPVRLSAFIHRTTQDTTQERSSNESTTTELPQTPRGTSEEGGSRRIKTRRMKTNTNKWNK